MLFDFPGYEDRFQITSDGRVRSKSRAVNSPAAGGMRIIKGKWRSIANVKGYAAVQATIDGTRKTLYVHRAIAELFVPNPDSKPHVNHIDGNKSNNDPANLEWCTHQENMSHAFATGLTPLPATGKGESSPSAKLTDEKVREVKRRLAIGDTHREIARDLSVSSGTIGFISAGKTWSHITI